VLFSNNVDGTSNLFGIYPYELGDGVPIFENSNIFEVELLKEVGLLGAIAFIGFVIFVGFLIWKYLKNSKDNAPTKSIFIVMLLAFFIYESIFHTIFVTVHTDSYYAFLKSPLLLFVLFVIGYLISDSDKKEEIVNE
jgi:O-antigen ligase